MLPLEFIQPIEITLLDYIQYTKFNHKLYNLIQNTYHEFSTLTEEINIIAGTPLTSASH